MPSKLVQVILRSTQSRHFYVKTRPPKTGDAANKKLELKKYDPIVRKHVPYKEEKIK